MTRQEQIKEVAQKEMSKYPNFCITAPAFRMGAEWADAHPNWISVEDELPPIGGIVLVAIPFGGELSVLPLSIKNEKDLECLLGMTHWMRLPQLPEGSEQ